MQALFLRVLVQDINKVALKYIYNITVGVRGCFKETDFSLCVGFDSYVTAVEFYK